MHCAPRTNGATCSYLHSLPQPRHHIGRIVKQRFSFLLLLLHKVLEGRRLCIQMAGVRVGIEDHGIQNSRYVCTVDLMLTSLPLPGLSLYIRHFERRLDYSTNPVRISNIRKISSIYMKTSRMPVTQTYVGWHVPHRPRLVRLPPQLVTADIALRGEHD